MPDANAINIVVPDQGYQSDGRGPGPKTKEQKELDRLRAENEALKAHAENGQIAWKIVKHYRDTVARLSGLRGDPCDREYQLEPFVAALKKERDQLAAKCAVMAESLWERSGDCELQGLHPRAKALLECVEILRERQHGEVSGKWNERVDKALAGLENTV